MAANRFCCSPGEVSCKSNDSARAFWSVRAGAALKVPYMVLQGLTEEGNGLHVLHCQAALPVLQCNHDSQLDVLEMSKNRACRVVASMAKIQGWNSEASQCEANAAYIVLLYSASPGRCQCCAALKVTALRLP